MKNLNKSQLKKIDELATLGLLGGRNSLAYRVHEIEKHFHGNEKWFGAAAAASGEVHVADPMAGAIATFDFTSGNSDFGNWVQILGSGDTPTVSGMAYFDLYRLLVTVTNSTEPYIFQIATGESSELAAKVAAGEFTSAPYVAATNSNDAGIADVMDPRDAAGTKVWARVCCIGQNAKTLSAYFGIHEYIG